MHCNNRRFSNNNTFIFDPNKSVGGSEVDSYIVREGGEKLVKHFVAKSYHLASVLPICYHNSKFKIQNSKFTRGGEVEGFPTARNELLLAVAE